VSAGVYLVPCANIEIRFYIFYPLSFYVFVEEEDGTIRKQDGDWPPRCRVLSARAISSSPELFEVAKIMNQEFQNYHGNFIQKDR